MVDAAYIAAIAEEHRMLASAYEAAGNGSGAAQLRRVSNLLYAIARGDAAGTVLPKEIPSELESEAVFQPGDLVVVKAIGEVRLRIDGPKLAYVVELERRDFLEVNAPSWATTRTVFALPDEVLTHGRGTTPTLAQSDREALRAWIDHLVEDGSEYEPNLEAGPDRDLANRGREILTWLLGR